jgi:hypothetical protein
MKMVNITEWASPEVKTVHLSQGFLDSTFELKVKQFIPVEGDLLERDWAVGSTRRACRTAPYAIANLSEAAHEILRFIDKNAISYIKDDLDPSDELIWSTYAMAYKYAKSAKVSLDR